jgi:4-oxalocrotonate tautomerase family enzyme
MPVINVKLPGPMFTHDQKEQLIHVLTDAFVGALGEQVRPFTFVIIEEAQRNEFGIAGRPMPDPQWLIGEEYRAISEKGAETIRQWIARQAPQQAKGS